MAWKLSTTRIYVSSIDEEGQQIIARLQPISSGTILHNYGWTKDIIKLSALVATEADKNALKQMTRTGSSYTLSGPEGVIGNFFVSSVKSARTSSTCISLFDRPSLPSDAPIYKADMELYIDA